MLQHALLLLSSQHEPEPAAEIRWHATRCATPGAVTAMATTRQFRQLAPGQSTVAFYADAASENRLLGLGRYMGFESLRGKKGQELYSTSELYGGGGHPPGIVGMLLLQDVREAAPGSTVRDLNGIITSSRKPLAPENLPEGAARLLIYFHRPLSNVR